MINIELDSGQSVDLLINHVPAKVRAWNVGERMRVKFEVETTEFDGNVFGLGAEMMFWANPAPETVPDAAPQQSDLPTPDAPAADSLLDLHARVTNIIRKAYFTHTRNEQLAMRTAQDVLEEVQRTYEQLAARAGLTTS